MRIRSFAKINLGLEVLGARSDGYHQIRTLYQTVGLCDVLEFERRPDGIIALEGDTNRISWGEDNLVFRAARLLSRRFAPRSGVSIRVKKKIPPGSGLGGGSSNAAMTLWALSRLWELGIERRELMPLAEQLGSDVPYFLEGGLCLGTGRGEKIRPLFDLPTRPCLLLLPRLSISTALIYGQLSASLTSNPKDSKIMRFLKSRSLPGLENELEETVFRFYPLIKEAKQRLIDFQPGLSSVSGSGSVVYGLFPSREAAERAQRTLDADYRVCMVETLPRDRYWQSVNAGV
jgi:4-diphosphocytidyl-2-C-methyl-D-erythritol kinase